MPLSVGTPPDMQRHAADSEDEAVHLFTISPLTSIYKDLPYVMFDSLTGQANYSFLLYLIECLTTSNNASLLSKNFHNRFRSFS